MSSESPLRYQVDWTLCQSQIAVLRDQALAEGLESSRCLAGELRTIQRALENVPLDWGEPYHELKNLELTLCVAFTETLMVRYGVHEESRIVFLRIIRPKRSLQ